MEVDKSNLRSVILNFANQLNADPDFFNQLCLTRRPFSKIIICGMGGSALAGNFFQYFEERRFAPLLLPIPLKIHRSYSLPPEADDNSLIICVSYSGDTEETISSYQEAKKQNLETACITYGGQLSQLCQQDKTPWIKLPQTKIPPRFSLGYQLAAFVKLFMAYGLLNSSAKNVIASVPEKINPQEMEGPMKLLCAKIANKIPIIYSSNENRILARLWKIQLNENSKVPAFFNSFPELDHNEVVGWTKHLGPFFFLFLYDEDDLPDIQKRMKITDQLIRGRGLNSEFIKLAGQNPLEKIFYAEILGSWLSYHLAIFYGIDPAPVEMVEELKKLLRD